MYATTSDPARTAARTLDAADGVADGRFFGRPIIVDGPHHTVHHQQPGTRLVGERTYFEPAPRVEPIRTYARPAGGVEYVHDAALAPRVVHTRVHTPDVARHGATYFEEPMVGRSYVHEPSRVIREYPSPTYVRGAPSNVEYLDLAESSPRVVLQPPLRRVVRSADGYVQGGPAVETAHAPVYETHPGHAYAAEYDAPIVVESASPGPSHGYYDTRYESRPIHHEYHDVSGRHSPSVVSHHRHSHSPTHHEGRHRSHPYELDGALHPMERGEAPVDAKPVDVLYKKSKKLIEVPITRKVKVPTVEERIVPTTRKQRVPTTKLVQEQSFKWVDEPYTDYEEREFTQMKEVWVKKLVPEKIMKKVPVKRSRKVKVPTTVTREVETVEEVEVPTTALVKVPAFRVDEIYETAQAEVETVQKIELVPRVVDEWDEEHRIIEGPHRKVERIVGQVTYDPREPLLSEVDSESENDSLLPSTPGHVALTTGNRSHRHRRRAPVETPIITPGRQVRRRIGFTLQSSSGGLVVRHVESGSPAEISRVEIGDVVRAVNGVPVNTNTEFQHAISGNDSITLEYWSQRSGRSFTKRINLIE